MSSHSAYHCFWYEAIGNVRKYEGTFEFDRVNEILTDKNHRDVKVVWGELLQFEPEQVVTKWKIKE